MKLRTLLTIGIVFLGVFTARQAHAATCFWVGGTGNINDTAHWASGTGGVGGTCAAVGGYPASTSDNATLDGSSGGGTVTNNVAGWTVGAVTAGAFTGTFNLNGTTVHWTTFNGSGSGTRTFSFALSEIDITGNNATIWTIATITNLTWSTPATISMSYSGSVGTRTFTGGTLTYEAMRVTAGSDTVTLANINEFGNFTFAGFTGTWSGATQQKFHGNLTLHGSMTFSYTGATTFNSTSGTQTLTSAGNTWSGAMTINAPGGTLKLADAYTSSAAMTLTAGTLDSNTKSITSTTFNANNTTTKTITITSSTWTITSSGTVWNMSTATPSDTTMNVGSSTINLTDATSTQKTFAGNTNTFNDVTFSGAGTGVYTFSGAGTYQDVTVSNNGGGNTFSMTTAGKSMRNLNFTGFLGQFTSSGTITAFTGDLTYGSGMTSNATGTITFTRTSGTSVITSNGVSLTNAFTVNGAGGTVQLADSLVTTGALTMTTGTIDTNGKSITTSSMGGGGGSTKVITMTNSTWTLTGTGTVWSINSPSSTVNASGSVMKINDSSASAKTMNFGASGITYGTVWLTGGGTGTFQIQSAGANSTTITTLRIDGGLTALFGAGTTTTVTNFSPGGTATNFVTLKSTTDTSTWTITKAGGGTINVDWLSIRDSTATPGSTWYANHSTDVSNNTGWIFGPFPVPPAANVLIKGL